MGQGCAVSVWRLKLEPVSGCHPDLQQLCAICITVRGQPHDGLALLTSQHRDVTHEARQATVTDHATRRRDIGLRRDDVRLRALHTHRWRSS